MRLEPLLREVELEPLLTEVELEPLLKGNPLSLHSCTKPSVLADF